MSAPSTASPAAVSWSALNVRGVSAFAVGTASAATAASPATTAVVRTRLAVTERLLVRLILTSGSSEGNRGPSCGVVGP